MEVATLTLNASEVAGKAAALAAHVSQQRAMGGFLSAFVRRSEPFTVIDVAELRGIALDYEPEFEQHVRRVASARPG